MMAKGRKGFTLNLQLFNGETFQLKNVYPDMKIGEMKGEVELAVGIPSHLIRLSYLDDCEMMEDMDIKHYDIIPDATITVKIWKSWMTLVDAAASADIETVLQLGVTQDTSYSTPNTERMHQRQKSVWVAERSFVSLYIAAHRGHMSLVTKLIEKNTDVKAKTPWGRTALHVAAFRGHNQIVVLLLNNGAAISDPDIEGNTPLNTAAKYGQKQCERHLFLFQWQQRAARAKPYKDTGNLFAHQMFDSRTPTWIKGTYQQMYQAEILPPGEFSGSALGAPRRRMRSLSAPLPRCKPPLPDRWPKKELDVQVELGAETLKSATATEKKSEDVDKPKARRGGGRGWMAARSLVKPKTAPSRAPNATLAKPPERARKLSITSLNSQRGSPIGQPTKGSKT